MPGEHRFELRARLVVPAFPRFIGAERQPRVDVTRRSGKVILQQRDRRIALLSGGERARTSEHVVGLRMCEPVEPADQCEREERVSYDARHQPLRISGITSAGCTMAQYSTVIDAFAGSH